MTDDLGADSIGGTYAFSSPSSSSDGGSSSSSSPFGLSPGALAALGIGAAGFGTMLARGESPLPTEFATLTGNVPNLQNEAQLLEAQGGSFINQGQGTLAMAAAGQLTDPQKAQLGEYSSDLKNQAIQTYAGMGRNWNQDTSAIQTQASIDARVNAMAQEQIRTTIQLGLGQIGEGNSLIGQGLGFQGAANTALVQAGQAQVAQDAAYSKSLTDSFSAIGNLFGGILGVAGKAIPFL